MPKCANCLKSFPNRISIDGKLRNLSSRKFCLGCSPFNKLNRRSVLTSPNIATKHCTKCNELKSFTEFYSRRNGTSLTSWCTACSIKQVTDRQKKLKEEALTYKGGKCFFCGYSKCNAAMDFHHTDPSKKDFTISHCRVTKMTDKIKEELDKCILLCSNCHREEHDRLNSCIPSVF